MLILSIDTSTRTGSAAVLRDDEILAEVSGYEETLYSNRLFRDVAALREKVGFTLGQVDVFAVASGPGSFTGLRVGLTAVKAWAEVHGKPIAAISGLEAIAYESLADKAPGALSASFIAPFLDARRGQIFGALFKREDGRENGLKLVSDESILSLDEFLEMVKGKPVGSVALVSPTPDVLPISRIQEALSGQHVVTVTPALAPAIGKLGLERAKRGVLVDALTLDANYVRRSDAEAAWKDR
jgi:tRNA threonylcarbamoyladenosine biosynthesis protein TsaB